ncbi:MAG: hypothetical protein IPG45_02755 [Deltaproteobacteria bacterium]|nr:hypothetical protein [Deltaproteobacteria bacterium]
MTQERERKPDAPWLLAGASLALAAACDLERPLLWLSLDGASSLLVVHADGSTYVAEAVAAPPYDRSYDSTAIGELHVLGYEPTLPELGLVPGTYPVGEVGLPIPRPRWAQRLDLPTGNRSPLPPDGLPEPLASGRLMGVRRCPDLLRETWSLDGPAAVVSSLAAIDPERALLATERGLYLVTTSSVSEVSRLPPSPHPITGIWAPTPSGDVWLARGDGAILKGHPDRGFAIEHQRPNPMYRGTFGGPLGGDGREIWGVTANSDLAWWKDGEWLEWPLTLDNNPPSVAQTVEGHLLVARRDPDTLYEIDRSTGSVASESLGLRGVDSLRMVVTDPVLGTVVGTEQGRLFRREDAAWRNVLTTKDSVRITLVVAAFGGWLIGGEQGVLAFHHTLDEPCESQVIGTSANLSRGAGLRDAAYFVEEEVGGPFPLYRLSIHELSP